MQVQPMGRHAPLRIPEDLREWIEESRLADCVLEAIWGSASPNWQSESALPDSMDASCHATLALISFCYATGLYGSQEIQDRVYLSEALQKLVDVQAPDEAVIRHFRRSHRPVIARILTRVFRMGWDRRFSNTRQTTSERNADDANVHLRNLLEEVFKKTAEDRILRAVEADSMWLDD